MCLSKRQLFKTYEVNIDISANPRARWKKGASAGNGGACRVSKALAPMVGVECASSDSAALPLLNALSHRVFLTKQSLLLRRDSREARC